MLEEPRTPRHRSTSNGQNDGARSHAMGNRVVCATPHRGKAVNNYSLGDRLGKGAFATVYKAIHLRTAEVAAIKQIPLDKIKSVDSVMGEIELLQDLEHPNIVKYFGFMKDDTHLNIVLEYCENGSLAMILHKFGSFPENLLARYMCQVLEGLAYLHKQGTIHRDIKGANILTTKDGVAKLADFGVATKIGGSEPGESPGVVGTPHWMAPEIIQMQEPSPACDVWSLGATIVELRSGKPPFGSRSDIAAMYAIVQQDSLSMIPADSSASLRDFLTLCFEKDPVLRVSSGDLLRHLWIRKYGKDDRVADTAQVVRDWNSPSRRRKLAVPSRINLREPTTGSKRSISERSPVKGSNGCNIAQSTIERSGLNAGMRFEEDTDENYEDDFASLGIFGKTDANATEKHLSLEEKSRQIAVETYSKRNDHDSVRGQMMHNTDKSKTPLSQASRRKPLAAFIEDEFEDEAYDQDYDVQSLGIGAPLKPNHRKNEYYHKREPNDDCWDAPLEIARCDSEGLKTGGQLSNNSSGLSSIGSTDPFLGLDDLLDDDVDEMLLTAQEEAKQLTSSLQSPDCDYTFVYQRLKELVVSKPQVRTTLEQIRLLPKSLSVLSSVINSAGPEETIRVKDYIAEFLSLVEACIPLECGSDFVTNFCIAGGLSFVLAQSEILPSYVLRLLTKMTSNTSAEDDKMSIARQLAFREDAIAVVCSFFTVNCGSSDIYRASSVILEMFQVCGPRHRSNLWHHFNAYGLFSKLVDLLHLRFVRADEARNELAMNLYELIVSFSRSPQELLLGTINYRVLRRLMRAYILLPIKSGHRKVLLEFFKNMSTLPPILDEMQKGQIAPHLIKALDDSMKISSEFSQEARVTANCLVPTLFNYTRIERSRKREVAQHELLKVLNECVYEYPGLREFVYPIFSALVHAGCDDCWIALWEVNALDTFINLITETGWQAMSIAAIGTWIEAQPEMVTPKFVPRLNSITRALDESSGTTFESILSAMASLIDRNRFLCGYLDLPYLFNTLKSYLAVPHAVVSSASLVQAVQIIAWAVSENRDSRKVLEHTGLIVLLKKLRDERSIPLPCNKLINQISRQTCL